MIKKIAVVLILLAQATLGYAQVSPEEHAQHHPEENATITDAPAAAANSGGGMMGGSSGGMMGGANGGGMGGMMEQMGAPKPKDMYPSLMALPNLPMEDRAELKQEAHQRMQAGASLMSEGMGALSASAPTDDFIAMQGAVSQIKQGLSQFDSGLAAHRALAEGKAPRNVALQWFKQEMGLLPAGQDAHQRLWFGLSPFHFFAMAMLVLFFGAMSAMYFFKMRRAAALLKQMASVQPISTTERTTPAAISAPAPNAAPVAKSKRWSGILALINTFQETQTVRTFRFAPADGTQIPFDYLPGQFLTVTVLIDGKKVKRSYTIASSPSQRDYIEITVKREGKGMVSRHLHDHLQIGDPLEIAGPAGKFTFTGSEDESIVLIAGGVPA
ncbi:FAD-binding oxidoreductase [Coraliomargarita sp. SDUM461004]|uniref:FAD-binding oxidoreductase n=1 Tax=Thalassobacterium sedimentorum TaxID=3041258 RepID=A0ABU1AKH5_9BACT|nr:FAD-binding oxidoreductase [Coraliomargarita sp. SDUM461004]MDQ8195301.1 FAD-binding oxidoreductase [Coraliomargarita sp. SDUM461004]